jgi:hypothetical protein
MKWCRGRCVIMVSIEESENYISPFYVLCFFAFATKGKMEPLEVKKNGKRYISIN